MMRWPISLAAFRLPFAVAGAPRQTAHVERKPFVLALACVLAAAFAAPGLATPSDLPVAVRFGVAPTLQRPPSEIWVMPIGEADGAWPVPTRVPAIVTDTDIVVVLAAGVDAVVFVPAEDQTYVLIGPMRWPDRPERRLVTDVRRRSVVLNSRNAVEALTWVDANDDASGWPQCRRGDAATWQCIGIPANRGGVLVGHVGDRWVATAVPAIGIDAAADTHVVAPFAFGVLIATDGAGDGEVCVAGAWRLEASAVLAATRYAMVGAEESVSITPLDRQQFWVSSREPFASGTSIRITCPTSAARVDGSALASASPLLPLRAAVVPVLSCRVAVTGANAQAAAGATVDLFAGPAGLPRDRRDAERWERVAGTVADAGGVARFDHVLPGRYEFRAVHPQLGSRSLVADVDGRDLTITLRPARRITGRITRGGAPAGGVPVSVWPSIEMVVGSPDVLDLFVPPVASDGDGRFEVAVPGRVPLEVRVGDPAGALRRLALAAGADGEIVNVGNLDLTQPIVLLALVALPPGCQLAAAGPMGRTGLSLIPATQTAAAEWRLTLPEPGRWHVSALCGSRELPLAPPIVDVPEQVTEWGVVLTAAPTR